MPDYSEQLSNKLVHAAEFFIDTSAAHADLAEMLANHGFDDERLSEGRKICSIAHQARGFHERSQARQQEAAAFVEECWTLVATTYVSHRNLARMVLKDIPGANELLSLDHRPKQDMVKWLERARRFYDCLAARPDLVEAMREYSFSMEVVRAAINVLNTFPGAEHAYDLEQNSTQSAIYLRRATFETLCGWLSEFMHVARIAFEDEPDVLQALGIPPKS